MADTLASADITAANDTPALEADGITKAYGGVRALDDMQLRVTEGTITGLIGPNGAGKSSLFDVLSGVQRPDRGTVRLRGQAVTGLPPHRLARLGLMRTFQLARELERMTVLENLMVSSQQQLGERFWPNFLSPSAVRAEDARVYTRATEIMDFVGLRPLIDEYAGNLSGGQKKLLELGRALMTDCRIVLLDEPGAGVNRTLMGRLIEIIRTMNRERGVTFLIVEHDMDLIGRVCDPIVVMVAGRRLTAGAFEMIRQDPQVVRAYLGGDAA